MELRRLLAWFSVYITGFWNGSFRDFKVIFRLAFGYGSGQLGKVEICLCVATMRSYLEICTKVQSHNYSSSASKSALPRPLIGDRTRAQTKRDSYIHAHVNSAPSHVLLIPVGSPPLRSHFYQPEPVRQGLILSYGLFGDHKIHRRENMQLSSLNEAHSTCSELVCRLSSAVWSNPDGLKNPK